MRLIDAAGSVTTFRAGDAFLVPNGFRGFWEVVETTTKHFVIRRHRRGTPGTPTMKPLDDILRRARTLCPRIVLPEGEDPRIVAGAARAQADGLARPVLLGDAGRIADLATEAGFDAAAVETLDPAPRRGPAGTPPPTRRCVATRAWMPKRRRGRWRTR